MKVSPYLQTFWLLLRWYAIYIVIFTLGRGIYLVYYFDRVSDSDATVWLAFLYGLRMDTMAACLLLLLPAFILHLSPVYIGRLSNLFLRSYFFIVLLIVIYMENATLPFINEYDVRPNIIFINYLKYPQEVLATIWAVYKPELLVVFIAMAGAAYWFKRSSFTRFSSVLAIPLRKRMIVFIPIFLMLFVGIRSSFGHRPANPSDAIFSNNRLLNEITKNTIHNVGYAAYSEIRHGGSTKGYGEMSQEEAFSRVASRLHIPVSQTKSPFRRLEKTHFKTDKPKNLIIILEESLGAQFVQALRGEKGITPNLNSLSKEGVFFERLYSNGTRSIRGIAGTVSGFLPTTGKGIVKRNLSQRNFFTVAALLKPYGYRTSFFYGGESRFDEMKSWFSGNGFDQIFDESAFGNDVFHGTWGVDDVSVLEKANTYYKELFNKNERFVSVVFSTTNHSPFDFPAGRIELVKGVAEKSVKNAIKYADYAIGNFIKLAKQSGYYDDTVIMIIADHNVRVYGDDVIPVDMFHIPGLILGGDVEPANIKKLSSQPDALAAAVDLLGLDLEYPILGNSVFDADKAEVSLMQYHDIYGLRYEDEVAVIQPGKPPVTYNVTENDHLVLAGHNKDLEKDALAFIIALDKLYRKQLYN